MTEAERIVQQLEKYSEAYYKGEPLVSDAEFDALEDELRRLDPANEYFSKNRETANGSNKYKHIYEFIGSIEKIHDMSESKLKGVVSVSAKLDGASMVAYYENGKLVRALTRGNGEEGVDITNHYLAITSKYKTHFEEHEFTGAIRGEVVFTNSNWEIFKNRHPEAKYARNSGTGLINKKTVDADESLLDWITYDVIATNLVGLDAYQQIEALGLPCAPYRFYKAESLSNELMQQLYDEWSATYPMDGIVIRSAAPHQMENGLWHWTKKLEAFKFQSEIVSTVVKSITWQLGLTGKLTPVLEVEPVMMTGALVSRITAHNAAVIREKQLGPGAVITAFRSGDVIPKLHDVTLPSDNVSLPTVCPVCGEPLQYSDSEKDLLCVNDECQGKIFCKFQNLLEQLCPDIKGIGEAFETELWNLFTLSYKPERATFSQMWNFLANDPSTFDTPSYSALKEAIAKRFQQKVIPVKNLLLALSVKGLGAEACKKLAKSPAATSELFDSICTKTDSDVRGALVAALPGQVALSYSLSRSTARIKDLLFYLRNNGYDFLFDGATEVRLYAITGSLSKPRKVMEAEYSKYGWQLTENISKCEVLITNNSESTSSKCVQAKKLGREILSEIEFENKYLA